MTVQGLVSIMEAAAPRIGEERHSRYRDLVYYPSTVTPGLVLAATVTVPTRPAPILAATHGWHDSMPPFEPLDTPPDDAYVRVHVDMRGRAFSTGSPDCNTWELFDIIDAVEFVRRRYAGFVVRDAAHFESSSGGGGNALALAGKFPDFFTTITALCPIADYSVWYENDRTGEFRDEMDAWIGSPPSR